ncbi:MAG: hypothetical protein M0Z28_26590 [Rhodospirillales bacterium]|nr:hypothetical protein [Rhodospirillales bacterium]
MPLAVVLASGFLLSSHAAAASRETRQPRFACLGTHGNSAGTTRFQAAIATMSAIARLQGSCCTPMIPDRYITEGNGRKTYAAHPVIPPDL